MQNLEGRDNVSLVERAWDQQPMHTGPNSVTNLLYDLKPNILLTSLGLSFHIYKIGKLYYLHLQNDFTT